MRPSRWLLACLAATAAVAPAGAASAASAAAPRAPAPTARPACVPVRLLDAELGIVAVAVAVVHPSATSAICSYNGATGHYKNQATVVYLRADAAQFAIVVGGVRLKHKVKPVAHLANAAYSFSRPPDNALYMLDGHTLVELFAPVPLARVERLARRMVPLVRT